TSGTALPVVQSHTYSQGGAFTIVATGDGVCNGRAQASVSVQSPGRVTAVIVSASPTKGTPVTFTVQGTPPCGTVQMNFGDGTIVTVPATTLPLVQTHTYSITGVVTVVAKGQTNCG